MRTLIFLLCVVVGFSGSASAWNSGASGQVTWAQNCNFQGSDIEKSPNTPSAELCSSLCLENPRCTHYSWDGRTHLCNMKHIETPETRLGWSDGSVCGFVNGRAFFTCF